MCPVSCFLVVRGIAPGPLFVYRDGWFLTGQQFLAAVREALQTAGVNQLKYCGHSVRIGAAATLPLEGWRTQLLRP